MIAVDVSQVYARPARDPLPDQIIDISAMGSPACSGFIVTTPKYAVVLGAERSNANATVSVGWSNPEGWQGFVGAFICSITPSDAGLTTTKPGCAYINLVTDRGTLQFFVEKYAESETRVGVFMDIHRRVLTTAI